MQVILDTNVLVSGLIKRNSKPEQIIDAILTGKIQYLKSFNIQVLSPDEFLRQSQFN
jgi:predicted nucleic acid-binding protein